MLLALGVSALPATGCIDIANAASASDLRAWTEEAKPLFALDDLTGKRRALSEFRGRVVLVHFFATWCAPCRDEMASLQRLLQQSPAKPLTVVAVDVAEVDLRVRAFFEKEPVQFPVLLDRDRAVARAWGVYTLPTTLVLDRELVPRLIVEGDLDWSHPETIQRIEALLPDLVSMGPCIGG